MTTDRYADDVPTDEILTEWHDCPASEREKVALAKLAEAKRLGMEAVALARDAIEAARDNTRGTHGHAEIVDAGIVAVGCLNVADAIAAALEAL